MSTLDLRDRQAILASEVARQVATGARVQVQTDYMATIVRGRRPNHLLHVILSIVTFGVWFLLVYIPVLIFAGEKWSTVTVDEYGNLHVTNG
jgi:cytochrome b